MTLNGGKIYGPKQSGALFIRSGIALQPQILGGGQERNVRSGTENVAAAIGFAIALDIAQEMRHEEANRLNELQQYFFDTLTKEIPQIVINGSCKKRLPNNVHITIPGTDNERLLVELDEQGILAAAGSACSASDEEPSHVLKSMGISDADAQSSLRLTMGRDTDTATIDRAVAALKQLA
jgi:cysteine desulfurase